MRARSHIPDMVYSRKLIKINPSPSRLGVSISLRRLSRFRGLRRMMEVWADKEARSQGEKET
jgi:hypothetical protein